MMASLDFMALAQQCAPQVSPATLAAIVHTESNFNPYAIGVVRGRLVRQPANKDEAIATAHALAAGGWIFSVGLAQVNRTNWPRYGLTEQTAFEPCRNLAAGAAILRDCFAAARQRQTDPQVALRSSLSCYWSGNFTDGYRSGYVQRVVDHALVQSSGGIPVVVPGIAPIPVVPNPTSSAASTRLRRPDVATQPSADHDSPDVGGNEAVDQSALIF